MATKAEIVSQAYLKITEFYPNSDLSRWYEDAEFLLAPAVNFVQLKQYFVEKNDEGERLIQPALLQSFNVVLESDAETGLMKFTLPRRPVTLPNGRGIQFIGPYRGQAYIPVGQNGGSMQGYYAKHKKNQASYELDGLKVLVYNSKTRKLRVRMIVDVSDLKDDDEILLPSGSELEVINLIVDFFVGNRPLPSGYKDYINSGKEANHGTN